MKNIVAAIVVLTFVFIGCNNKMNTTAAKVEKKEVPVRVMKIEKTDFIEIAQFYGRVSGIQEATLVSTAGGIVESIDVVEGQWVEKGQSLGKVDSDKAYQLYKLATLNESVSRKNYQTKEKLFSSGNASEVERDQAHIAWLKSKSDALDAKKIKEGAFCETPISGTVVARYIEEHDNVRPSSPTFAVAQLHKLKINTGILESDISGITEGSKAKITFNAYPDKEWEGFVNRISRKISDRTLTFDTEIYMNNPGKLIRSGVTANVLLQKEVLKDQIVIPTRAILTEGESHYVMCAEDGQARKYDISIGKNTDERTLILKGLSADLLLIVEGYHLVDNGTPIKIISNEND